MRINFKNVDKNFGLIDALKDISFDINSGDFVFLFGPSGSGKSTIIKLILSQLQPSAGQIKIGSYDLATTNKKDIDALRKKIGIIFQDYQLINDKSLEENIALNMDIAGFPSQQIPGKIDEVIKKVNLSSRRFLYPSQLSGGELQRAALARALSTDPKIILADEPTGNLDQKNSWNLVNLLKDINQKQHCTVLMATHDVEIVRSMGKKIIYLQDGRIVKNLKLK
ncbi:ATP-binding cassette domain-containing protein [Patescibacteria group bacterium]|nr:ATP-binding cassette domain-containing protein [Patescibacteria group bacterium]